MDINDYQVMPPLTDEEYAELKKDIQDRGVMVPIEFDEMGNCLDGHHRLQICSELGIKDFPTVVRAGMTEQEKLTHARALNVARRHLTREQKRELIKAQIVEAPELSDSQIAKKLGVSDHTVKSAREDMGSGSQFADLTKRAGNDGKTYPGSQEQKELKRQVIQKQIEAHPDYSDREIAGITGSSKNTVAKQRKAVSVFNPNSRDTKALKDPDIVRRMAETGSNVAGAIREQTRDKLVESLESIEAKEVKAAEGVYDVIVIDPPWPMERIETDARPHAILMDYPVMSVQEIKEISIPASDNCHVFLWTTQKFLPDAFDVLKAWEVKYVCEFVWHKDNGYKPFGLPKYNCEFVLYGRVGSPKFIDEKNFWTCFNAPIKGHSSKPEEFYAIVRRVTAGRRLDMFNRRNIEGFDLWGKEAANV